MLLRSVVMVVMAIRFLGLFWSIAAAVLIVFGSVGLVNLVLKVLMSLI